MESTSSGCLLLVSLLLVSLVNDVLTDVFRCNSFQYGEGIRLRSLLGLSAVARSWVGNIHSGLSYSMGWRK